MNALATLAALPAAPLLLAAPEEPAAVARQVFAAAKAAFCPILLAHGIARVVIAYDGSGDEGQVHDVLAFNAADEAVDLPNVSCERVTSGYRGEITIDMATLGNALDNFAYEALAAFHGGWEDNDGSCGEITIDTAEQSATLDHNWRITAFDSSSEEI